MWVPLRRLGGGRALRRIASCVADLEAPGAVQLDFAHHAKGLARLNHGSFGACPGPVLRKQEELRRSWLEEPDNWLFSGHLPEQMRLAAASTLPLLKRSAGGEEQVCLLENATVATVAVARRWAKKVKEGDVLLVLSVGYTGCINALREYVQAAGAEMEVLNIPFPGLSHSELLDHVEEQLSHMRSRGRKIRFAVLDHVSSQPALLLPVKQMVSLCRVYGAPDLEILVDGAHSVGSCSFDVEDIGADWFLSNLHKWGFAPTSATVLYAASPDLMLATGHPITSWGWQQGLVAEAGFPGTRDFTALLSTPAAMKYLQEWRSEEGETAQTHCHRRVLESAKELAEAWSTTAELAEEELVATQAMVKLPADLVIDEVPGSPSTPSDGVRAVLRKRFRVEAAVGSFPGGVGGYVRLSYAIYNTREDVEKLRDAVLELLEEQRRA